MNGLGYKAGLLWSLEEAKEFFHDSYEGPTSKEYWKCYGRRDNKEELQELLDVIYNPEDGDKVFVVKFVDHQSTSRIVIKCTVCQKDLSSYDPFKSHEEGKSHKKALCDFLNKDNVNVNMKNPVFKSTKSLQAPSFLYNDNTVEDLLDRTMQPYVGAHMLYMEDLDGNKFYTCRLCVSAYTRSPTRMDPEETFRHVICEQHAKKYLATKYHLAVENYDSNRFDKLVEQYWKIEGKISNKVALMSKTDIRFDRSVYRKVKGKCTRDRPSTSSQPKSKQRLNELLFSSEVEVQTDEVQDDVRNLASNLAHLNMELRDEKTKHPFVRDLTKDPIYRQLLCEFVRAMSNLVIDYSANHDKEFVDVAMNWKKVCPKYDDLEVD